MVFFYQHSSISQVNFKRYVPRNGSIHDRKTMIHGIHDVWQFQLAYIYRFPLGKLIQLALKIELYCITRKKLRFAH